MQRRSLGDKQALPSKVPAVKGQGQMTEHGQQLENHEWFRLLTKPVVDPHGGYRRVGRDPKLIPAEVLIGAGHTPRSATVLIKTYFQTMSFKHDPERDTGIKRLRELCGLCSGGSLQSSKIRNEVRNCACVDCPLWAHRLGFNPHTWHARRTK